MISNPKKHLFQDGIIVKKAPDLSMLQESLFNQAAPTCRELPKLDLVLGLTGTFFDRPGGSDGAHAHSARAALELARNHFGNANLTEDPQQSEYHDSLRMVLLAMERGKPTLSISNLRYAINREIREGSYFAARILLRILLLAIAKKKIEYNTDDMNLALIFHHITRHDPLIEEVRLAHMWSGLFFEQRGYIIDTNVLQAERTRRGGDREIAEEIYRYIMWTYSRSHSLEGVKYVLEQPKKNTEQIPAVSTITKEDLTRDTRRILEKYEKFSPEEIAQMMSDPAASSDAGSELRAPSCILRQNSNNITLMYARDLQGNLAFLKAWRSDSSQLESYVYHYFEQGARALRQRLQEKATDPELFYKLVRDLVCYAPTFDFQESVLVVAKENSLKFD